MLVVKFNRPPGGGGIPKMYRLDGRASDVSGQRSAAALLHPSIIRI
jgi:hypothetical protein